VRECGGDGYKGHGPGDGVRTGEALRRWNGEEDKFVRWDGDKNVPVSLSIVR